MTMTRPFQFNDPDVDALYGVTADQRQLVNVTVADQLALEQAVTAAQVALAADPEDSGLIAAFAAAQEAYQAGIDGIDAQRCEFAGTIADMVAKILVGYERPSAEEKLAEAVYRFVLAVTPDFVASS